MSFLTGYIPPLLILAFAAFMLAARWFYITRRNRHAPLWFDVGTVVVLITAAALIEYAMGRAPFYQHGAFNIWSGNIWSDQNSQQLFDPYTFTHITHGVLLYALLSLIAKYIPLPIRIRLVLAVALEVAWEVFENTNMVINQYRAATISLNYFGDSIVNSMGDIFAAVVGFVIAAKLPAYATITGVILMEIILALWIRDGLLLNIVMLAYPIQAIKAWQLGNVAK